MAGRCVTVPADAKRIAASASRQRSRPRGSVHPSVYLLRPLAAANHLKIVNASCLQGHLVTYRCKYCFHLLDLIRTLHVYNM